MGKSSVALTMTKDIISAEQRLKMHLFANYYVHYCEFHGKRKCLHI